MSPNAPATRPSFEPLANDKIIVEIAEPSSLPELAEVLAEVEAADLAQVLARALAAEGRPNGELTLVVTSDEEVAALNRQYRGVDGPTDVLSFPAQEPTPGFVSAPEMADYLGDIIIALPYTRRQAAELGRSLRDELRLLAVHGALHLLGYDHAEPETEAVMWARQEAILTLS